eukprot:2035625-Rhodomonas_salina.4
MSDLGHSFGNGAAHSLKSPMRVREARSACSNRSVEPCAVRQSGASRHGQQANASAQDGSSADLAREQARPCAANTRPSPAASPPDDTTPDLRTGHHKVGTAVGLGGSGTTARRAKPSRRKRCLRASSAASALSLQVPDAGQARATHGVHADRQPGEPGPSELALLLCYHRTLSQNEALLKPCKRMWRGACNSSLGSSVVLDS